MPLVACQASAFREHLRPLVPRCFHSWNIYTHAWESPSALGLLSAMFSRPFSVMYCADTSPRQQSRISLIIYPINTSSEPCPVMARSAHPPSHLARLRSQLFPTLPRNNARRGGERTGGVLASSAHPGFPLAHPVLQGPSKQTTLPARCFSLASPLRARRKHLHQLHRTSLGPEAAPLQALLPSCLPLPATEHIQLCFASKGPGSSGASRASQTGHAFIMRYHRGSTSGPHRSGEV